MSERILGPSGSKRRRRFLWVPMLLVACAALFVIAGAQAVHDTGAFQLDGDATSSLNTAGTPLASDDWDKVCYQVAVRSTALGGGGLSAADATAKCGIGLPTTGATETAWTEEPNPASSIFTGGGSKDPQNLDQWSWKDAGGLPDKDNLQHAYAARYSLTPNATTCPSGGAATCELLFAGLDRFDNSGDAQNGVWFFQSKVTTAGGKSGGGTGFTGLHTNNDVLVVSDFSNGGTTSTITVYTWDSACTATGKPFLYCADANLHLQETSDNANCRLQDVPTAHNGDAFCGIVNPSTISLPWSFTDKSATPANGALNGEFYEEGINLSLLGLAGTCFSSVLSETRSSTSTTAVLKDFVLGQLGNCTPALTTSVAGLPTGSRVVSPGTAVHDTATITVTGATSPDDATGTVSFAYCYSATANPDCSTGGVGAGTDKALSDTSSPANTHDGISGASSDNINTAASPLAPGFYCFRAVATLTNYASPAAPYTNNTSECFRVSDTTSISTAQKWLPQDTATISTGSGGAAPAGSVVFSLYTNGTCAGTAATTFTDSDGTDGYATNNATYQTASTTISWSATFTPTDATNISGSTTTRCETSVLTITNNSGAFPPA